MSAGLEGFEGYDEGDEAGGQGEQGQSSERTVTLSRAQIKQLEQKARRVDEAEAGRQAAERRLAFAEAGIDTTKPMGRYFVNGYDGDVNPEAIRKAAIEAGLLEAEKPPVQKGQQQPAPEQAQQQVSPEDAARLIEAQGLRAMQEATATDFLPQGEEQGAIVDAMRQAAEKGGPEGLAAYMRSRGLPVMEQQYVTSRPGSDPDRRNPWLEDSGFMQRVSFTDSGCWEWTGSKDDSGYGILIRNGVRWLAHRWSFQITFGTLDPDLTLDHLCRNIICCNPDHLEQVTLLENNRRSPNWTGNRTHCPQGHEYTPENTYRRPSGRRECRECRAARRSSGT